MVPIFAVKWATGFICCYMNRRLKGFWVQVSLYSTMNQHTSLVTRNTTNLKGRKPPTNSCTRVDLYHGSLGSSLAIFFVLHGESNVPAEFLPIIPPMTVSGYPTVNKQKT